MIANCNFEALLISNCLFVNEGSIALLIFAKNLKNDFFMVCRAILKDRKKEDFLRSSAVLSFEWLPN